MLRLLGILGALMAGCAVAAADEPGLKPKGAKIEPSGYATVLNTLVPDYSKTVRPRPAGPRGEAAWYAQDQKISVAEARKRQDEQNALRPRFEKLLGELRAKERGNFTDARVVKVFPVLVAAVG